MSKKVVIAGACRTAIGKMGGALSTTPAPVLGSIVIKEALNRAGVPADQVDHVYMGCVIQAGLGQNVARQAALKAGLPIETPAVTVNVVCGSGLNCVNMAAQMIQAGDADIVVAGGMENMSMAPYALPQARFGYRMNNGTVVDTMVNDALTDAFNNYHMMITAENVADQWGLTREELDEFSANSQQKCEKAMAEGKFKDEIVPVEVKTRKQTIIVDTDEGPRAGTTVETLSKLRCCSGKPDGVVTAGNASGINDGAAAVVVMIPGLPLNHLAILVQVISGILMTPILVFLTLLTSRKDVMGEYQNTMFQKIKAWIVVAVLGGVSILSFVTLF